MTERRPVDVCAIVLAAGEGRRLRPLTRVRPKALCPVGNVTLLDHALTRVAALGLLGPERVAVNASYLGAQVVAHVGARARLSVEPGAPLGTSGGVAKLKDWIDGRGVLVGNADAYLAGAAPSADADPAAPSADADPAAPSADADIAALLDGWDGETVRLLGVAAGAGAPEFGQHRFAGFSLLPWSMVVPLNLEPADLVRTVWRPAEAAGRLAVVEYAGTYLDTGTPHDYLTANLHAAAAGTTGTAAGTTGTAAGTTGTAAGTTGTAAGGAGATGSAGAPVGDGCLVAGDATVTGVVSQAVIGARAVVRGRVTRGVVWPDGYVGPDEHLVDAVRVGRDLTVPAGVPPAPA